MATVRPSSSHEERTASQPRQPIAEPVVVGHIEQVNTTIRKIRLQSLDKRRNLLTQFLPGQWLDVFIPCLPKAGGFTITSAPQELMSCYPKNDYGGYLQIAVQNSSNPPAKWFHQPESEVLNAPLIVRAGGSFTWPPPPPLKVNAIRRLVLIGGGVGINPFQSIVREMMLKRGSKNDQTYSLEQVKVLYATKAVSPIRSEQILFVNELLEGLNDLTYRPHGEFKLLLTGVSSEDVKDAKGLPVNTSIGRITEKDLLEALGDENDREGTVVYVCGPPTMTDTFVQYLGAQKGMTPQRVLCEKWW